MTTEDMVKKSAQSFLDLLGGRGYLLPRSGGVDEKEAKIVNFLQKVTSASGLAWPDNRADVQGAKGRG